MDIFFHDPDDIPLPPEEIRVKQLEAKPWPDGKRVAIRFHITSFQQRPNIEIRIYNDKEEEISELSVVEALETKMEFTMHLREIRAQGGNYKVKMRVFYTDLDRFAEEENSSDSSGEILKSATITSDQAEASFEIPGVNK